MFRAIRRHLTPSTLMAFVALVFALTGGAFAATGGAGGGGGVGGSGGGGGGGSSAGTVAAASKVKSKGKAGPRGPAGPRGAVGPAGPVGAAGPAGPAGAQGPQGSQGPAGSNGSNGEPGAPGASVASKAFAGTREKCKEGGSEFTVGSTHTYACNGEKGVIHPGETLPAGASETGEWSTIYTASAAKQPMTSAISFPIPLSAAPEAHYIGANEELAGQENESPAIKEKKCGGNFEAPEAASGNLCVFSEQEKDASEYLFEGIFPSEHLFFTSVRGTVVGVDSIEAGEVTALGSWVVTG